jgi:anti-sigma B factor antagonist
VAFEFIDMDVGEVTILQFTGRITLGQGTQRLREAIDEMLERGRVQLLLDFGEVGYVDSSGLGELVLARKRVLEAGGVIKLMKLKQIMRDLIQVTHLCTLFEVFKDEKAALESFGLPESPAETTEVEQ